MITLSNGEFFVEVLSESWQYLREDECSKLEISLNKKCWVREVFLYGMEVPWVYARSIVLDTGLNHPQYALKNIGKKPLGAILFADNSFKRTLIEVTHYPIKFLPNKQRSADLWARRSCFMNSEVNVLVQEVFLPAFWQKNQIND